MSTYMLKFCHRDFYSTGLKVRVTNNLALEWPRSKNIQVSGVKQHFSIHNFDLKENKFETFNHIKRGKTVTAGYSSSRLEVGGGHIGLTPKPHKN